MMVDELAPRFEFRVKTRAEICPYHKEKYITP
jgi:hypothetical protein